MKKIIWIDVGTHFGQEYNSIFGSNFSFYKHIGKRFLSGNILRRGQSVSFQGLKYIVYARNRVRKRSREFYTVLIEANPKIVFKKNNVYKGADMVFNLALTDNSQTPVSITKLYLGNGNELSQGSSVFLEKENVDKESYISVLGVSTNEFFSQLGSYFDKKFDDYDVLLRLNCEGVEDEIIYSASNTFGNKLKLICGSLKDVEGVKGLYASQKLDKFITDNKLLFIFFHSGIDSWPKAHCAVLNLLEKNNNELAYEQ